MENVLQDLRMRSLTPIGLTGKNLDIYRKTNEPKRNVSLSPFRNSAQDKSMIEFELTPKPISYEIKSEKVIMPKDLNDAIQKKKRLPRLHQTSSLTDRNTDEAISAIFVINNCSQNKILALDLVSMFVSLGFCDSESASEIFCNITEGINIRLIKYSKDDLIKICRDPKTNFILKTIIKNCSKCQNEITLNDLLSSIKKMWNKLEKNQYGLVEFDELINFYSNIGVVETTSDIKRVYLRVNQSCNFKQFINPFSKPLLRFLILKADQLIQDSGRNHLSPDIALTTHRRKLILNSIVKRGNQ